MVEEDIIRLTVGICRPKPAGRSNLFPVVRIFRPVVGEPIAVLVGKGVLARQRRGNQDDNLHLQFLEHFRITPDVVFHLPAVDTTPAGEVDHDRFVVLLRVAHVLFFKSFEAKNVAGQSPSFPVFHSL